MNVDRAQVQRRTVRTLALAQVFSAVGMGSALALGPIMATELAGGEAFAGSASTAMTLGSALAAMPLSRLALARGRRIALSVGLVLAIVGSGLMIAAVLTQMLVFLLVGALGVGIASAVNLQARFAVTDLAEPAHRGRDLAFVVWAITIGAVAGPNLVGPGARLAGWLHLPAFAGAFLISGAAMVTGALIIWVRLRPDPLMVRRQMDDEEPVVGGRGLAAWAEGWRVTRGHPTAIAAIIAVASSHAVMVAIMSMTPVHIQHQLGSAESNPDVISIIGITISLHVAGMYGLSPLMGWLTDRLGPVPTFSIGVVTLLVSAAMAGFFQHVMPVVTIGLILLGLGWSAATVAASTLLVQALAPRDRVPAQGFSDATMSLAGAAAAAGSGPILGAFGYDGIALLSAFIIIAAWVGVIWLTQRDRVVVTR